MIRVLLIKQDCNAQAPVAFIDPKCPANSHWSSERDAFTHSGRRFRINRKIVVRKLLFLAGLAKKNLEITNIENAPVVEMQFDDLETLEHTKLKPLSITLAVASSRRILGFAVASMPAKGLLAKLSRAKYGFRRDDRSIKRKELFSALLPHIDPLALIKSDQNPHYPPDVKSHFPKARHEVHKGRRGCVVGQGELKKIALIRFLA